MEVVAWDCQLCGHENDCQRMHLAGENPNICGGCGWRGGVPNGRPRTVTPEDVLRPDGKPWNA